MQTERTQWAGPRGAWSEVAAGLPGKQCFRMLTRHECLIKALTVMCLWEHLPLADSQPVSSSSTPQGVLKIMGLPQYVFALGIQWSRLASEPISFSFDPLCCNAAVLQGETVSWMSSVNMLCLQNFFFFSEVAAVHYDGLNPWLARFGTR